MSTLRVSNIEAKSDASSPSVNEKVKVTNSNGDVLVHVNGETSGITTIGINTTGESVSFDSNQNATFVGIVTANQITVGDTFLKQQSVGIGSTTTVGRNAGIGTAIGTLIYNSTTNQVEGYGPAGWASIGKLVNSEGLQATGGTISDYEDGNAVYRAHIFTGSGTFEVTSLSTDFPNAIDCLVVAGGGAGGGGTYNGGGGGAGGFRELSNISVSTGTYPITVGAGAVGSNKTTQSMNGSDSIFNSVGTENINKITSTGGGGGGTHDGPQSGRAGGSGGGGTQGNGVAGAGNTPPTTPAQGYPGAGNWYAAGVGGGGAGGAHPSPNGGNSSPYTGGSAATAGGIGRQSSITGTSTYYAGGGGGGQRTPFGVPQGIGGLGGGGNGGTGTNGAGFSGTSNTGGGGGGKGGTGTSTNRGGSGGSGIVVVRYQIGETQTGTAKATGGAISFSGGKTIHTFTSSGTFTITNPSLISVDYLAAAGGGGGGSAYRDGSGGVAGGGGGAGGLRTGAGLPVSPGSLTVTVGSGGGGGFYDGSQSQADMTLHGLPGGDSSFSGPALIGTVVASGGGGGGGRFSSNPFHPSNQQGGGGAGGCSGAASGDTGTNGGVVASPDGRSPTVQGFNGDNGVGGTRSSGGGGGAGGNAPVHSDPNGGPGGIGVESSISGSPTYYCGGGGGGGTTQGGDVGNGGTGGQGGGGNGASKDSNTAQHGTNSTGGGGGAGSGGTTPTAVGTGTGGNGGSGIVIISYPT